MEGSKLVCQVKLNQWKYVRGDFMMISLALLWGTIEPLFSFILHLDSLEEKYSENTNK